MKTNDVPSVTVSDDQLMLEAIDARIAGHQTAITVLTERRETLVRALTSGSANQPKVKPKGKKRGPVWTPERRKAHGELIRQRNAQNQQAEKTDKGTTVTHEATREPEPVGV